MKKLHLIIIWTLIISVTCACGRRQQLKSFNNALTADDSLNIELSKATDITYHSETLGLSLIHI